MATSKKSIATKASAVVLAVALLFGLGSYSYLTSTSGEVINEFEKNNNDVELDETTGDDYDIVPGTSQDKDPTITATYTLNSYVYVEVTDATDDLVTWYIANGWALLSEETDSNGVTTSVYYMLLEANYDSSAWTQIDDSSDAHNRWFTYTDSNGVVYYYRYSDGTYEAVVPVLQDNTVYYSASITNEDMDAVDGDITLTFQAYIIQADPFADAENAWLALNGDGVVINDNTGIVYTDASTAVATAISEAEDGETVRLLTNNLSVTDDLAINNDITLDLDGYTLNTSHFMVYNDANLVIQDGTLNCTTGIAQYNVTYGESDLTLNDVDLVVTSGFAIQYYNGTITIDKDSSVTNNGSNTYAIALYPFDADDFVTLNVYGTISATGSSSYAIGSNADTNNYAGDTLINIYDNANITATDCAIYHPQRGIMNIYGGTISGYCGIITVGGTTNIYDGTIIGTANDLDYKSGASRPHSNGSAIIVFAGTSGYSNNTVNISGGTFQSTYCYGLWTDALSGAPRTATINITGGTFNGVALSESDSHYTNVNQTYSSSAGEYAVSNAGVSYVTINDNR
ncbi:MAG: hypothetical protein LUH02_09415 [Erysipelotrichaceae bacterium]|nr:hypothetical protein [Erysipelotrichaceae bacterium]